MELQSRQQEALLAFGRRANAHPSLAVLMQDAVALVAGVLDADLNGVSEVTDGRDLALSVRRGRDGSDLEEPKVHRCPLNASDSMSAYTLRTATPTVSVDLPAENRFSDLFLRRLGVRSAVCVPLHLNGKPFGTLGAYTTQARQFSLEDVCFAETVAHLLSSSIARVRLEEELHVERTVKSTVLEMVDAMVLTLDMDGRVVDMNRACEANTKYSLSEVRARPFWNVFVDGEESDLVQGVFRKSKSSKIPNQFEGYLRAKDGSYRRVSWSLKVMCTGQVQSIVLTGVDQTEHLETKQQLAKAKSLADRATRALKQLTEQLGPEVVIKYKALIPPEIPLPAAGVRDVEGKHHPAERRPGKPGKEKRGSPRREYPYRQIVAPVVDGRLPSRNHFFAVQCKDISASGFAFLLDFLPDFETLVAALGRPPALSYFTARVMRVAQLEYDGSTRYLVGCRFLTRLSQLPGAQLTESNA